MEGVIEGKRQGESQYSTNVELIVIMPQYGGEKIGFETLDLVSQFFSEGVRGVDVAGDIREFGLETYSDVFKAAYDRGVGITIHAGEITPADSVRIAIEELLATRIGHGIRSIDDPAVLDLLIERQILLEICPTSNLQTNAIDKLENHPIGKLFERGVKICINTDDPGISNISLSDEYELLKQFGLCNRDSLLLFNQNAIQAAFTSEERKAALFNKLVKGY